MKRLILALSLLLVVGVAACTAGGGGGGGAVQDVQVTLTEFKIQTSVTSFSKGVSYRFVVKNAGAIPHEFMIMPRDVTDHTKALFEIETDELGVGATGNRTYTFQSSGNFEMSCHIAGHYEGGMKLPITVQ